jgi:thiol-disulfide isomerase/thioredoxin
MDVFVRPSWLFMMSKNLRNGVLIRLATKVLAGLIAAPLWLPNAGAAETKIPIGSKPADFTLTDIHYLPRTLDDYGHPKAFVLVFTTTGCPIVRQYLPRLKELSKQYHDQGVQFIAVNEGLDDSIIEVAYQALEHQMDFPFVKDFDGQCARAVGAGRTPQVIVLDGARRIFYRGRVDDQYRLGGVKPSPDRADLREALEDVLAGRPARVAETAADGCRISFPEPGPAHSALTYARDIAPLINKHCVVCHRAGTAAPFALANYDNVASKAATIAEVVEQQRMPPWFAHPEFGKFVNERRMTAQERAAIVEWARGGNAAGDLSQAPKPPEFQNTQWTIGEPDLVITAAQPEKIPAAGYIPYRYVILPHVFLHDIWVTGIQIMPGNARVVHHANLAYVSLGEGFNMDRSFLTGKVPGGIDVDLGSGVAMLIPRGSVLALEIHYVTTGKEETDQISVGLRYAREPVHKRVRYKELADNRLSIPPGAPFHLVAAQKQLECDATGVGVFSHMHLRGKDSTFFAHYPDGRTETLLSLPNYSFDWQLSYVWPQGTKHFPKGTRIECSSHFDNSPLNPYNPNPKATVRFGPQTHDEMMIGFFFYTDDSEDLNLRIDPKTGRAIEEERRASAN